MAKILREETKALIDALQAVSEQAGPVANALMLKRLPPAKQYEYAQLLRGLADSLDAHASSEEEIAKTMEGENDDSTT